MLLNVFIVIDLNQQSHIAATVIVYSIIQVAITNQYSKAIV
ncbi:13955_t:CDS:2 [Cetraspora pellucida]|uniref:13955_t:CDS:1 n=1 Tax=Cetraspora pellucida TaxID=1433469 RepID=A0ACA9LGU2_9GLOM|nr:13955_t:CDS:2 [Cetraspora pellucida]